ncbi:SET domain-containing protein-lysine N-methyltransferase [Candidatus Peribacteria bacterium]|nr:SET domain-containing protein-lysine N-methyltransferase [Candidatus Peribacteria bacterium]
MKTSPKIQSLTTPSPLPDHPALELRTDSRFGRGVFTTQDIPKDTHLAGFYGEFSEAATPQDLPGDAAIYALQCGPTLWRDGDPHTLGRYINHSCEPNCGIRGLYDVVAMRDIKAGEQLFWHYGMTDRQQIYMTADVCKCGSKHCQQRFVPYAELSESQKAAWAGYCSSWLTAAESPL